MSEQRCVKCGHGSVDHNGRCQGYIDGTYVAGIGVRCDCKCSFSEAAASEGVPERIWIPTSAATLMEVSPELQNVEGAWYVRESASSVDKAADASKEYVRGLEGLLRSLIPHLCDYCRENPKQPLTQWGTVERDNISFTHTGFSVARCDASDIRRALISQHQETK